MSCPEWLASRYASSARENSPRSRWSSACRYKAPPTQGRPTVWESRSHAEPGLAHGVRPGTLQLHDLRAVHQALAAIGNEVRLRRAPLAERRRPLLGPAQVEDLLAFPDHRAVDDPDTDRRHLAGGDGHHDLVEQRHAFRGLPRSEERLADADATERHELRSHRSARRSWPPDRRWRRGSRCHPPTCAGAPGARAGILAPRSRAGHRPAAAGPGRASPRSAPTRPGSAR